MSYKFSVGTNPPFRTVVAGATDKSVSYTASGTDFTLAGLSGQGILNVEVFSAVSCSSVVSIPFTIFDVNPGTIGDDSTHCASENPDTIANTASATSLISSVTFTYYWQSSSNSTFPDLLTSDINTVTSTHYPFSSALPATTHFRRVATASLSGVSTEVFSDEVTKTVIPSPSSINLTSNQAQNTFYHDGTTNPSIEITATADQPGLTYVFTLLGGGPQAPVTAGAGVVTAVFSPIITAASTPTVHVKAYPGGDATCSISTTLQIIVFDLNAGTISGTQDVCLTATPATITSITPASSTIPTAIPLITYEWQATTSMLVPPSSFSTLAGTNPNYTFASSIPSSAYYQRVAKLTFNSVTVSKTSGTSELKKVINVLGGSVSPTQSYMCDGNPSLIEITGGLAGGDYTYQWQSATTNSEASFTNLPAPSTASSYTPTSTLTVNTFFRRITTYAGSAATAACNTATSTVHTANVNGLIPGSLNINQNKTYCYGTKPQEIDDQVAATGQSGTISYTWWKATSPFGAADWTLIPTSSTDATYQPPHLTVSTWFKRGAFDTGALACQTYTNVVKYTILNEINNGTISVIGGPATGIYCVGDLSPNLSSSLAGPLNAIGTNLSIQWEVAEEADPYNFTPITSATAVNNTYIQWPPVNLTATRFFRARLRNNAIANNGQPESDQRILRLGNPPLTHINNGAPADTAITNDENITVRISPSISLVVTATAGGIDTIDKIGQELKTQLDGIGGYNGSYDANTNMLQILKDDNAFQNISVQITAAPAAPQTLTAQVINSIDNDTYCDVYTPVLPIIVKTNPSFNNSPSRRSSRL